MSVYEIKMKTHSRVDITNEFADLNDCVIHGHKPNIFEMVVGRRKEKYFVANCDHVDCGKIESTKEDIAKAWNKWNPVHKLI